MSDTYSIIADGREIFSGTQYYFQITVREKVSGKAYGVAECITYDNSNRANYHTPKILSWKFASNP